MGTWKKKAIKQHLRHFRTDDSGQFAVWFALLAVPLITMLAYVGDMTYAGKVKADLKGSLDAAALAAVINQNLTETERAAFAQDHFNENFKFSDHFKLDVVNASANRVELSANGGIPSYLGAMTGRDTFGITGNTASELTSKDVICVLALDPNSEDSFLMEKGAKLYANECSVQVNSTNTRAAVVQAHSTASAKSFCVAGGVAGSFTPYANTECSQIKDPYEDVPAPPFQACLLENLVGNLGGGGGGGLGGLTGGQITQTIESLGGDTLGGGLGGGLGDVLGITDNQILEPGTYCSPVVISGQNVRLNPGTYVFQDSLIIMDESSVWGEGVTIALNGPDSAIEVMGGSQVHLKAPGVSSGGISLAVSNPYAGLAIFQNAQNNFARKSNGTTGESYLRGGSGMNIVGTVYLPTQRIYIGSESGAGVINGSTPQSPATSFIAHQVHLVGSTTSVAVNHQSAGLPPMLPRSDEGARLVK